MPSFAATTGRGFSKKNGQPQMARELLGNYKGNAQTDGYEGYDQFEPMEGITMYGCWAHVRRKFVDALETDRKHATEAIVYIRKLYEVESKADETKLSPEERKAKRLEISYPTIQVFEKWMLDTYHRKCNQATGPRKQKLALLRQ